MERTKDWSSNAQLWIWAELFSHNLFNYRAQKSGYHPGCKEGRGIMSSLLTLSLKWKDYHLNSHLILYTILYLYAIADIWMRLLYGLGPCIETDNKKEKNMFRRVRRGSASLDKLRPSCCATSILGFLILLALASGKDRLPVRSSNYQI